MFLECVTSDCRCWCCLCPEDVRYWLFAFSFYTPQPQSRPLQSVAMLSVVLSLGLPLCPPTHSTPLQCYLLRRDGSGFKVSVPFQPYVLIRARDGTLGEVSGRRYCLFVDFPSSVCLSLTDAPSG
jgi:hypothetical protein